MPQPGKGSPGRTWLILGLLCVAAGAAVTLIGLDVIPTREGSKNAPPWVIVAAGAVFVVAGAYVSVLGAQDLRSPGTIQSVSRSGSFNVAGWLVAAFIVSTFFAMAAWVAFGPGERAFSGGIGGGGAGVSGPLGDRVGRIAFGVSAVVLGAASVWIWAWGLSKLRPGPPDSKSDRD